MEILNLGIVTSCDWALYGWTINSIKIVEGIGNL